jgi:dTDP-4-dehydrorhamnose 3,5-epimerase
MRIESIQIPGCYQIFPKKIEDKRGSFVKTFEWEKFEEAGLVTNFAEEYYSHSQKSVLRGLHFQVPPHEHTKIVYCLKGEVFDVLVDLRCGSPTFGKASKFILSAESANLLYIAPGIAHGFYVLSEEAVLQYKVTSSYKEAFDSGINWNSVEIDWPSKSPNISVRDNSLEALSSFKSPFTL